MWFKRYKIGGFTIAKMGENRKIRISYRFVMFDRSNDTRISRKID